MTSVSWASRIETRKDEMERPLNANGIDLAMNSLITFLFTFSSCYYLHHLQKLRNHGSHYPQ